MPCMATSLAHTADPEAVGEEGKVPVLWSELRATHHLCQGSKQDMIALFGMPIYNNYMLTCNLYVRYLMYFMCLLHTCIVAVRV